MVHMSWILIQILGDLRIIQLNLIWVQFDQCWYWYLQSQCWGRGSLCLGSGRWRSSTVLSCTKSHVFKFLKFFKTSWFHIEEVHSFYFGQDEKCLNFLYLFSLKFIFNSLEEVTQFFLTRTIFLELSLNPCILIKSEK